MSHLNVIFDLDDTLIPTRWRYGIAKFRCGHHIVRALGGLESRGSAKWIEHRLSEASYRCGVAIVRSLTSDAPYGTDLLTMARDYADISQVGFSPEQFRQSWIATCEKTHQDCGRVAEKSVLEEIERATSMFTKQPFRGACAKLGLGFPTYGADLVARQSEIDAGLIPVYGFSQVRFPLGWVATYQAVCKDEGVEVNPAVEKTVYNAAATFRRGPFWAFPEALEVLQLVRKMNCTMHLITIGDRQLQQRKIEQSGLRIFFENRIHIEALDKRARLRQISAGNSQHTVMIGDSMRSDIAAAVDVGIRAVLIPNRGHWSHDDAKVSRRSYFRINSIQELPKLLEKMSSCKKNRSNNCEDA